MTTKKLLQIVSALAALAMALPTGTSAQVKEHMLHSFSHGAAPTAGLTFDTSGNLFGTAWEGGTGLNSQVFELSPAPKGFSVPYEFCSLPGCPDGGQPLGSLIFDSAGNIYGTTGTGGSGDGCGFGGCGTVFELTPNPAGGKWTETLLYNFTGFADGGGPSGALVFDSVGNLYGTAALLGNCYECGTVFELTPASGGGWIETTIYSFTRGADGGYPTSTLILDPRGNLYGTASQGGTVNQTCPTGCGVVFELTPNPGGVWTETVLHSFTGGADGATPNSALTPDAAGNLFGSTTAGGLDDSGVVFELLGSDGWNENVLYTFTGGPDGKTPSGTLVFHGAGNLYGTSAYGGVSGNGVVFQLTPVGSGPWKEQVFSLSGKNGKEPFGGVIFDAAGNAYGTTAYGGKGEGVVFQLTH